MTIQTAEDFRRLVRETIDASGSPSPADIADKVLGQLAPREAVIGLSVCLTDYVRRQVGTTAPTPTTHPKPTGKPGGSSRVKRIRDDWRERTLSARVFNGAEWKFFRDFTADDCRGAAAVRIVNAERNQAEGDRLLEIAKRVEESGGQTVDAVETDTLRWVLSDGAV